jgi:heme oxygenase
MARNVGPRQRERDEGPVTPGSVCARLEVIRPVLDQAAAAAEVRIKDRVAPCRCKEERPGRHLVDPLTEEEVDMKTVLSPPVSLSVELRERTREAHVAAEAAFALDARLVDLRAYGELLIVLRGFYGQAEVALGAVEGWSQLTPPIDVRSRRRAALLDDDLRRLGIAASTWLPGPPPFVPILGDLAAALGCLYVLEGSTLGGQSVARRARLALGEQLPVRFFAGSGRGEVGPRWRCLQAALDAFGSLQEEPGVVEEAVVTARETFADLASRLQSSPIAG